MHLTLGLISVVWFAAEESTFIKVLAIHKQTNSVHQKSKEESPAKGKLMALFLLFKMQETAELQTRNYFFTFL